MKFICFFNGWINFKWLITLMKCFRIEEQQNFPKYSKNHAHLFLNACLWNSDDSKRAITRYAELRAETPECFSNRDPSLSSVQIAFDNLWVFLITEVESLLSWFIRVKYDLCHKIVHIVYFLNEWENLEKYTRTIFLTYKCVTLRTIKIRLCIE